jgi:gamma-glutamyl:cysteine ligase YbdK (ATP-grasp superfamily)
LLQEDSLRNRKFKEAQIGDFTCEASNNGMSARCAATQYNVKFPSVSDVLNAYNAMVDVIPLFVSIFGNSPFTGRIDTGLDDRRVQTLRQTEGSLRCILPKHAKSLFSHYRTVFPKESAFVCDNPSESFYMTYSGVHTALRIKIDESDGHARVEFRIGDSMNPFEAVQGALYLIGMTERLRDEERQDWSDTHNNFDASIKGMNGSMTWNGRAYRSRDICSQSLRWMAEGLRRIGIRDFDDFMGPLKERVSIGVTNAGYLRGICKARGDIINPVLEYMQCGKRGNNYVIA